MIPYGRQQIDSADIKSVLSALSSARLTQGPRVGAFEAEFARYCGAAYATAVSNGTAALHLACLAAGIGPGDEVITSPITFLATANAVLYAGATPVFADVDAETGNLDPSSVEKKLTRKTKAIMPVHLAGQPARMDEIARIAKKRGLVVIEDACHALGAEYRGKKIGACVHSDMAVFSFHPVKLITTGEGGCVTTDVKKYRDKMEMLRSHGVHRDGKLSRKHGGWYYEMRDLGFNYRLTDLQCALGSSQLKKADGFIRRRIALAAEYNRRFARLGDAVKLPAVKENSTHAWHLYVLRVTRKDRALNRRKLYDFLRRHEILAQVHYIPLYRQPYYRNRFGIKPGLFPNAECYYEQAISLPLFPDLTARQQNRVAGVVEKFFERRA